MFPCQERDDGAGSLRSPAREGLRAELAASAGEREIARRGLGSAKPGNRRRPGRWVALDDQGGGCLRLAAGAEEPPLSRRGILAEPLKLDGYIDGAHAPTTGGRAHGCPERFVRARLPCLAWLASLPWGQSLRRTVEDCDESRALEVGAALKLSADRAEPLVFDVERAQELTHGAWPGLDALDEYHLTAMACGLAHAVSPCVSDRGRGRGYSGNRRGGEDGG
jgi:hypothetical protein